MFLKHLVSVVHAFFGKTQKPFAFFRVFAVNRAVDKHDGLAVDDQMTPDQKSQPFAVAPCLRVLM
jgi:hypothetical protein